MLSVLNSKQLLRRQHRRLDTILNSKIMWRRLARSVNRQNECRPPDCPYLGQLTDWVFAALHLAALPKP